MHLYKPIMDNSRNTRGTHSASSIVSGTSIGFWENWRLPMLSEGVGTGPENINLIVDWFF